MKKQTIKAFSIIIFGIAMLAIFFMVRLESKQFDLLEDIKTINPTNNTTSAEIQANASLTQTRETGINKPWPTVTKAQIEPTNTPTSIQYLSKSNNNLSVETTSTPTGEEIPIENSSDEQSLASPFIIGFSVENRPLEMYRFGNGKEARLITAGIHGGYEYNTTNLAYELIDYLQENPGMIPDSITLFILPTLNPDGLNRSYGYAGRANANNVDLNRNWNFDWKESWNPAGCWAYLEISGGIHTHSEPEVQALDTFITEYEITTIISYHSAALGIFAGNYPNHQPSIDLAEAIASIAPYSYPPIETGCEFSGQFIDYTAKNGVASVDIELTNHKDSDLEINKLVLNAFLGWVP
ncbi:MAG: hypothetical protein K8R40_05035 [Anaerolineaceae bacterium]|nr:hypothetical protein [Anaerolineaceae bacterium]